MALYFSDANEIVQKEVQEYVNNFQMIGQWISSVPIIAFSIIAGALSDVFGRKPLMLLPMIGDFIATLFSIVNYAYIESLPLEFFYTDKIGSFFGGYAVYYLGVYSYGTTVTKTKERAHRLARLDGMETVAIIIGTILSPIIFKSIGYFGSYSISCLFLLLAIIYMIIFVEEPMKRQTDEQQPQAVVEKDPAQGAQIFILVGDLLKRAERIVSSVINFIQISVKIPLEGMRELLMKDRKTILKYLIAIQFICFSTYWLTLQIWNLYYLYMLLVFKGFNETDYANFNVAMSVLNTFCLVILMPILSGKFEIHDSLLIFIMLMFEVVSSFITPFVTTVWQFYLAQGLGTFGYCKYAVVRSLISKCIDSNEVGKVYSFMAVLASLAPVAGNPLFRQLYNKTLDTFPGAIFLLYAAILFCSAIGNLFLYVKRDELKATPGDDHCDDDVQDAKCDAETNDDQDAKTIDTSF